MIVSGTGSFPDKYGASIQEEREISPMQLGRCKPNLSKAVNRRNSKELRYE